MDYETSSEDFSYQASGHSRNRQHISVSQKKAGLEKRRISGKANGDLRQRTIGAEEAYKPQPSPVGSSRVGMSTTAEDGCTMSSPKVREQGWAERGQQLADKPAWQSEGNFTAASIATTLWDHNLAVS